MGFHSSQPAPLQAGEGYTHISSSPAFFVLSPGPNGRDRYQLRASANREAYRALVSEEAGPAKGPASLSLAGL